VGTLPREGPFTRQDRESDLLRYYAQRLSAVEINYTFYSHAECEDGRPAGMRRLCRISRSFLKAPQRITHIARSGTWTTATLLP